MSDKGVGKWLVGILGVLLCLGLGLGAASGQSLAELAKKEKERREKLGGDKGKVITDRELQQSYGGLPATAPPAAAAAASGEGGDEEGEDVDAEEEGEEQADPTKTREYWEKRVAAVKEKIAKLEEELNSPELSWGEGLRADVNPLGQRNLERRQQLENDLAAARAELAAIQEEARRAGVPPGWVR